MPTLLKFSDIENLVDRDFEEIDVPQWGGTVRLAVMTGKDRDDWEQEMLKFGSDGQSQFNPTENMRASLVARCWVDENFERVVSKKEVAKLGQKSSLVLSQLFEHCQRINKITEEELEELEKNSDSDQSADSGTS